jgi:tetratricopeptide (TPR) repeat protein
MYARAVASLRRALSLNPKHVQALFLRGFIHQRCKRLDAAYEDFKTCLSWEPTHYFALMSRAFIHFYRGKFDAAAEAYTRVIDANTKVGVITRGSANHYLPMLLSTHFFIHSFFTLPGGFNHYLYSLQFPYFLPRKKKAASAVAVSGAAYANRALVLMATGQYMPAIVDLTKALNIDPTDAQALSEWCVRVCLLCAHVSMFHRFFMIMLVLFECMHKAHVCCYLRRCYYSLQGRVSQGYPQPRRRH